MDTEQFHEQHLSSDLPVAFQLEMHRMIQIEAYLKAEADGFKRPAIDYWLEAEEALQG